MAYKIKQFTIRNFEIVVSSLLLFFSLLILQAILVNGSLAGSFGSSFVNFLSPYIGLFGVWLFCIVTMLIALTMLFNKNFNEIPSLFKLDNKSVVVPPMEFNTLNFEEQFTQENRKEESKEENKIEEESFNAPSEELEPLVEKEELAQEQYEEQKEQEVEELFNENSMLQEEIEEKMPLDEALDCAIEEKAFEIRKIVKKEPLSTEESIESEDTENSEVQKIVEKRVIVEELEENKKLLAQIDTGKVEKPKDFTLPSTKMLEEAPKKKNQVDEKELDKKIGYLIEKLEHFKIQGDVVRTYAGPVVSTFEFKPAANIKVSKILNLQDDLAMALSAQTIRIQAPIPGKDVVGIEIPNDALETIYLRELLESELFKKASSPLTIALGKDIVGKPFITDLKKLPHLLIAGTTGSGKSVGINAMILSLLYKNSPDDLKLLMIDPKMLEFSIYNDIPHLLTPVITKAKQAIVALQNMVYEMERRYKLMSETRTKNIENYNEKVKREGGEKFPYIVVIIDELADLMMTSGKDVEFSIARLAQMARASGIHLIVATQRPSVDVVTGLIKANLPSRISYKVGQKIDSKIILDQQGAESLLGRGDMLFTPPGMSGLVRIHAPWSSEVEIEQIVDFLKDQREVVYDKKFLQEESELSREVGASNEIEEELDELYEDAKGIVLSEKKTSISYLQRRLQIGYNRSARIIEQLENQGVLSAPNTKGHREILG